MFANVNQERKIESFVKKSELLGLEQIF